MKLILLKTKTRFEMQMLMGEKKTSTTTFNDGCLEFDQQQRKRFRFSQMRLYPVIS